MNVYYRKVLPHDITHEISLTQYVFYEFFSGKSSVFFQIRGEGHLYYVTFNNATDLRFGADFKAMCRLLDVHEGDFIVIKKTTADTYSIDVERKDNSTTKPYYHYFTGTRRHLIVTLDNNSFTKLYVR